MEVRKTISMKFKKDDGKTFNLSVKNPGPGVNEEAIKKVMDKIIEKKEFKVDENRDNMIFPITK